MTEEERQKEKEAKQALAYSDSGLGLEETPEIDVKPTSNEQGEEPEAPEGPEEEAEEVEAEIVSPEVSAPFEDEVYESFVETILNLPGALIDERLERTPKQIRMVSRPLKVMCTKRGIDPTEFLPEVTLLAAAIGQGVALGRDYKRLKKKDKEASKEPEKSTEEKEKEIFN